MSIVNIDMGVPMLFGSGAADHLGSKLAEFGCKNVMAVIDGNLPVSAIETIKNSIANAGINCVIFDEVEEEVPDYVVLKGAQIAKKSKIDGLVSLGGGSAIDTAKCINVAVNHPLPLRSYYRNNGGVASNKGFPLVVVTTTPGSGGEHMKCAVVCSTEEGGIKRPIKSPGCCLPRCAIIDPQLMCSLPVSATASCSMDAFAHAYEAYTCPPEKDSPIIDAIAFEAMRLVVEALPKCVNDPFNVEYRGALASASTLAGIANINGGAHACHGIAHSVGSMFHVPHGVCVAWVQPYTCQLASAAYLEKNLRVLSLFGVSPSGEPTPEEVGSLLKDALLNFNRRCGVPGLKEYGGTRDLVRKSISLVESDPLISANKKIVIGRQEITDILENISVDNDLE